MELIESSGPEASLPLSERLSYFLINSWYIFFWQILSPNLYQFKIHLIRFALNRDSTFMLIVYLYLIHCSNANAHLHTLCDYNCITRTSVFAVGATCINQCACVYRIAQYMRNAYNHEKLCLQSVKTAGLMVTGYNPLSTAPSGYRWCTPHVDVSSFLMSGSIYRLHLTCKYTILLILSQIYVQWVMAVMWFSCFILFSTCCYLIPAICYCLAKRCCSFLYIINRISFMFFAFIIGEFWVVCSIPTATSHSYYYESLILNEYLLDNFPLTRGKKRVVCSISTATTHSCYRECLICTILLTIYRFKSNCIQFTRLRLLMSVFCIVFLRHFSVFYGRWMFSGLCSISTASSVHRSTLRHYRCHVLCASISYLCVADSTNPCVEQKQGISTIIRLYVDLGKRAYTNPLCCNSSSLSDGICRSCLNPHSIKPIITRTCNYKMTVPDYSCFQIYSAIMESIKLTEVICKCGSVNIR